MRVPDPGDEQPLAWSAALLDTPVYASDDELVGTLAEVLGSQEEDIFHGIVINSADASGRIEVPAAEVKSITNVRIDIAMSSEETRRLPTYRDEPTYRLKVRGGQPRDVSWTVDRDKGPK